MIGTLIQDGKAKVVLLPILCQLVKKKDGWMERQEVAIQLAKFTIV